MLPPEGVSSGPPRPLGWDPAHSLADSPLFPPATCRHMEVLPRGFRRLPCWRLPAVFQEHVRPQSRQPWFGAAGSLCSATEGVGDRWKREARRPQDCLVF